MISPARGFRLCPAPPAPAASAPHAAGGFLGPMEADMSPHKWPVPAMVRFHVLDAIHDAASSRGEAAPAWVLDAVREGVGRAVREHEAERQETAA